MIPAYSIIIPAYNEEALLPRTLDSVQRSMAAQPERGELIVVDNNSTDATARVAEDRGAHVVFEPINQISRARNTGAGAAQGQSLLFVDADTLLPPEVLRAALDNLADGRCCGGGATVDFDQPLSWLPRKFRDLWNRRAVKIGIAAGCFVYCTREGFDAIGGFSEKVYVSEEIWFSRALRSWGKKRGQAFRVVPSPPVISSARKLEWFSSWYMALILLAAVVFPFAIFFRRFCWAWYKRPEGQ